MHLTGPGTDPQTPVSGLDDEPHSGAAQAIRWLFPMTGGPVTRLLGSRITLGRGDECDLRLAATQVSRMHAELRREGGEWVVRDLDSTNGVFVNAAAVREAKLSAGDVVRLGDCVGIVLSGRTHEQLPVFGEIAPGLLGGPTLRRAIEPARRAAATDLPIILEGETGSGKERTSQAIHRWSGRAGPFVAVNCAAIPEGLAEGELFGYRKGAFTGADRASAGHFRAADGGTLLLDEIIDLPSPVQAKLLRVVEERQVLPLGESRPVPVDVRVIVAAQEPLLGAVEGKRFRPDLYARLAGLTVRLPSLRERIEDVPFLFLELLAKAGGPPPARVDARLIEALCLHDWPFNVRELDLLVRRLVILHGHEGTLRRAHLPERMLRRARSLDASVESEDIGEAPDLAKLVEALTVHRGNVARAAAAMKISRQKAYRLMQGADVNLEALRAPRGARG